MGLCKQIHDNMPKAWVCGDDKYPLTRNQMDTLKEIEKLFCFDVDDLIKEWRVIELICECMDLMKELDEMKRYGTVSKEG